MSLKPKKRKRTSDFRPAATEPRKSSPAQEFEFWSDGSCVFLRVPQDNHEADSKHVSHGLSEGTARRLLAELSEILSPAAVQGAERAEVLPARQWLIQGGGGYEDGEANLGAHSWTAEGLIRMLEAYGEDIEEWWSLALAEANELMNREVQAALSQRHGDSAEKECTCDNAAGLHWGKCPLNMKRGDSATPKDSASK